MRKTHESDWNRIESLFHKIADLNAHEKELALEKLRSTDPKTFKELTSLLSADENPNQIFGNTPYQLMEDWDKDTDLVGSVIGAFRLEEIIGEGAMGTVFRANRADGQFEQTVAIKLLKSKMLRSSHRELFDRERQILARLNHPGIARLYDGGFTDDERPYFTMEWISGLSLTDYVKSEKLSLEERVDLFIQVCKAVRYAHQSLVAHLDLKPGNIIVNDGGIVKLLDFGVSRLVEDNLQSSESFTLAYAAPEQVRKEAANTVSDIYSLGVIFYELISGQHPCKQYFDNTARLKEEILEGSFNEFSAPGIPGDLQLICAHAMKKEPDERYSSVDELLGDLNAYLNDYPISVRKRDWKYVGSKYFRRHRKVLTAVGIALVLLSGMGIYYTWQLQEQRNIAQEQAKKANQITELLTDVFMAADPNIGGADTITAVNLLDQGAENLKENLKDDLPLYADMQLRLSDIYYNLGQYEKGKNLSDEAYTTLQSYSDDPKLIADAENQISKAYYYYGQLDSSELFALQALKHFTDDDQVTEGKVEIWVQLANTLYDQGRIAEADSLYKLSYEAYNELRVAPDPDLAFTLHMMGSTARTLSDLETAEDLFMQALSMKQDLYEEPHLEIAYTYNYLGSLNQSKGDYETALDYIKQSYVQRKAILGDYHVETMASMANMARTFNYLQRYDDAVQVYDQTLDVVNTLFGKSHYYYAALIGSQGVSYMELGNYEKAREGLLESYELFKELNPNNVLRQVPPLNRLGELAAREGNLEKAKTYYEEVLQLRKEVLPPGDKQIAQSQQTLGECLLDLGDYTTAIRYLENALETFESYQDTGDETIDNLNTSLARAYKAVNDLEKAGLYEKL